MDMTIDDKVNGQSGTAGKLLTYSGGVAGGLYGAYRTYNYFNSLYGATAGLTAGFFGGLGGYVLGKWLVSVPLYLGKVFVREFKKAYRQTIKTAKQQSEAKAA